MARKGPKRLVTEPMEHLLAGIAEVLQEIARVVGQAATVGKEVGQADVGGDPGVGQGKARDVFDHRVVPFHRP